MRGEPKKKYHKSRSKTRISYFDILHHRIHAAVFLYPLPVFVHYEKKKLFYNIEEHF